MDVSEERDGCLYRVAKYEVYYSFKKGDERGCGSGGGWE
jgi:hypothetical protein